MTASEKRNSAAFFIAIAIFVGLTATEAADFWRSAVAWIIFTGLVVIIVKIIRIKDE